MISTTLSAAPRAKRRFLIVGGTGFIGRHVCQHFHQLGIEATVLSRHPDQSFLADYAPSIDSMDVAEFLCPTRDAQVANFDLVLYLGHGSIPESSWKYPGLELDNNVKPVLDIVSRVLNLNPECHIVYASSGGQIYGEQGIREPIRESCKAAPNTPYALGKHLIEQLLEYFANTRGAKTTILRIANPVGMWQTNRKHGFVSAVVSALRTGSKLTVFGDGHNVRDYFDVDDLAALLARFKDDLFQTTGTFNIGSGIETTEVEVIETAQRLLGGVLNYTTAERRAFDLRYAVLDVTRATEELGWRSTHSLSDIIRKLDRFSQ